MKLLIRHDGVEQTIDVTRNGPVYEIIIDGRTIAVDLVNAGPHVHSLRMEDGTQFAFTHHRKGRQHEVTLGGTKTIVEVIDPLALKGTIADDASGEGGVVKALMPGRIVKVLVARGDVVGKGKGLLILEAMKMENEIVAPVDGTVEELFVQAGDTVEGGAALLHIG